MMITDSTWGSTTVNNSSKRVEECSSSKEREARSVALEKAYVHDIYQNIACHFSDSRYRAWPKVKQFLLDLEPGSVVCDVGCGNGKYLSFNPSIYKIGLDRCSNLTGIAREKDEKKEVLVCDNLALPFRDECFDAVLSIAVIHHFATTERRVAALKELARVLRIGGRLMVSVWAMEQRHRKFESQDVLVPWNRPNLQTNSSDDKTSSIERDLNSQQCSTNSTTSDADDDATHYHAYTQTSDSDSFPSLSVGCRKRGRGKTRGRSIDQNVPSSSGSSDLSSPNESCYSFVRRALQKIAGGRRGRRPWFLQGFDLPQDHLASMEDDVGLEYGNLNNPFNMPIELRQLESTEFTELLQIQDESKKTRRGMLFSNVLYPRRRRTLETACQLQQSNTSLIGAQPKSKSLSDLLSGATTFGLIPARLNRKSTEDLKKGKQNVGQQKEVARSQSSLSGIISSHEEVIEFPDCVRHKAIQTESSESYNSMIDSNHSSNNALSNLKELSMSPQLQDHHQDKATGGSKKYRPTLVKQKHSICSSTIGGSEVSSDNDKQKQEELVNPLMEPTITPNEDESQDCWGEIKQSVKDLPEFKHHSHNYRAKQNSSVRAALTGSPFWKQTSLNEELIFSERVAEKERLKQHIQKQCSLNEELIYRQRENTRWDQMKEAFLNSSNVKCLQLIKHGLSSRFRGTSASETNHSNTETNTSGPIPSVPKQSYQTSSLRNGLVRMLQNWKQGEGETNNSNTTFLNNTRRGSKEGTTRRGLFPPFFLRRNSAGSLNLVKIGKEMNDPNSSSQVLSPPPYLKRRPSDDGNGNKLLLHEVRNGRKLSREDGSDSSKDSSFQSDTSVDSEDSFASVIFIPKTTSMDNTGNHDPLCFNNETRANSTDSDRSPKSPASRLSPPNHNVPKSPSPLASEIFKRSPEVSPTRMSLYGTSTLLETTKFVFDESAAVVTPNPIIPEKDNSNELVSTILASVAEEESPSSLEEKPIVVLKKEKVEKIEVLRKPANLPDQKSNITRQLVRRSLPKALAVELFNPETDDADTSDTSSSSPNSVSSVVSVVNEDSWNVLSSTTGTTDNSNKCDDPINLPSSSVPTEIVNKESQPPSISGTSELKDEQQQQLLLPSISEDSSVDVESLSEQLPPKATERKLSSSGLLEAAAHVVSSLENLVTQSSPKARRKFTLARLGSTSEWLSNLSSSDVAAPPPSNSNSKRHSIERRNTGERNPGEKILIGEGKKPSKGPDAKWPYSITDESPPQTAKLADDELIINHPISVDSVTSTAHMTAAQIVEDMDEKDSSLYDSMENLTNNPSIDSSVRLSSGRDMSSTCSCSIRGGDSFDSWTSAKSSSLTNSSSTHHKTSFPSLIPLQIPSGNKPTCLSGSGGMKSSRGPGSSKAVEDTEGEDSTALTYHRYYHVFREGELDRLIEKYVQNLHVISSYYDHYNWCIIAEKVQVWTI